jgi:hypothetical protein
MKTTTPPTDLTAHLRAAHEAERRLVELLNTAAPPAEIAERLAVLACAYQIVVSAVVRQAELYL